MNNEKTAVIVAVCAALDADDNAGAVLAARHYPFTLQTNAGRGYSTLTATQIFLRDGFVDRYSGVDLINPGVLRILSKALPGEFPFQKNWKMSETHPAYWELFPTIDHVNPVARGGADVESNLMTTSMLRNSAKANWTLEELKWVLQPAGELSRWDGLTGWMIRHVERRGTSLFEPYVVKWYRSARQALAAGGSIK